MHSPSPPCSIHCIMPPHMLEAIELRGDVALGKMARRVERDAEESRFRRQKVAQAGTPRSFPQLESHIELLPQRRIYDGERLADLPGQLVREEGDGPIGDAEADQAFEGAGDWYRFFAEVFERNSLDNRGMVLTSTVHHCDRYSNAMWNGQQMAYGDGDGTVFHPPTRDLSIIAHELSHGVVQFSGGLLYQDQPGALNEHIADVFGSLTVQYKFGQEAGVADWLVGREIFGKGINGEALRSMKAPGMAYDDELLGKDPQPFHMDDYVNTIRDNGGVHINSGIPNHAFFLLAMMLGGRAWEKPGQIWYHALLAINNPHARFSDWAEQTVNSAHQLHGRGSLAVALTRRAWKLVGLHV